MVHSRRSAMVHPSSIKNSPRVLLDFTESHCKEPHSRSIQKHHHYRFVLINCERQRPDQGLPSPANLTENREVQLLTPEKIVGGVIDDSQPAGTQRVVRYKTRHAVGSQLESFLFLLRKYALSHASKHVPELVLEASIEVRLLRLIDIEVNRQHGIRSSFRTVRK